MIFDNKSSRTTMARFGIGTLEVSSRPGRTSWSKCAVVELIECGKSEIGKPVPHSKLIDDPKRIKLLFRNIKSVDVLIAHLESVKEMLKEQKE